MRFEVKYLIGTFVVVVIMAFSVIGLTFGDIIGIIVFVSGIIIIPILFVLKMFREARKLDRLDKKQKKSD